MRTTTFRMLKGAVTRFFKVRKARLTSLAGKGIRKGDDFFEAFVLVRLAETCASKPNLKNLFKLPRKKPQFRIPASPSPSWSASSFLEFANGLVARTGIEVHVFDGGTVELDVVVAVPSSVIADRLPASGVSCAFECKAHTGTINATVANEVIGKAVRIWLTSSVASPANQVVVLHGRYALCALETASANALKGLGAMGIDFAELCDLDAYLTSVVKALGI